MGILNKIMNMSNLKKSMVTNKEDNSEFYSFLKDSEGKSGYRLIKDYGAKELIQQGVNASYELGYLKNFSENKIAYKNLKEFHKHLNQLGEKGSINRYKAISYAFRVILPSGNNRDEFLYYNEVLSILMDSVTDKDLIYKVVDTQNILLNWWKNGNKEVGVSTDVLSGIHEIKLKLYRIINENERQFKQYQEKIDMQIKWQNMDEKDKEIIKTHFPSLYKKYTE